MLKETYNLEQFAKLVQDTKKDRLNLKINNIVAIYSFVDSRNGFVFTLASASHHKIKATKVTKIKNCIACDCTNNLGCPGYIYTQALNKRICFGYNFISNKPIHLVIPISKPEYKIFYR